MSSQEQTPFGFPAADAPVPNIWDDGSDSELSDVESSGDEGKSSPAPARKQASPSRSRSPPARRQHSDEEDEAEDSGDDDDAGDGEYAGEKAPKGVKVEDPLAKLSFKKKPKKTQREDGSDEEHDGEPKKKRKKTKGKSKGKDREEEEVEEVVDPEVARRRNLDARIDAIIKKPKSKGGSRKKRGGQQDDDLEAMNDEAIVRLRNEMYTAADADIEENEAGRYAVHKLRMLQNVVEMMQKVSLAESLVENGILEAVKRWLEPLPDRSLPAINIQRPLFEILRTLSIETSALKASGLGKVVYFYTKCKRVEPFIQRMANQLVSDWMRPIIRRSKLFTDKDVHAESDDEQPQRRRKAPVAAAGSTNEAIARRHARIPEMLTQSFKIAPAAEAKDRRETSGQVLGHSATGVTTKMKAYKKRLVAGQAASRRV